MNSTTSSAAYNATALPGLDLAPLNVLHLTLQSLGFTDEMSDADLNAIVAETRPRVADLPPLELSLGPVGPDAEGIGLLVDPWNGIEHLRATIAAVWRTIP
ncbi:2'-5' RNA ligase family protein [Plantactinospora sp. CA-290183]|uniref:2'-5' RNA ligase family protein n=1 Tax=Plantactinospora sp. CA-290183 TaxID=3240006 RepID=UPI003D9433BB